ncbi:MAG: hypothetical protein Q7S79_02950, partial [bacterium]|nr:hypothetical protein [bacterium]
MRKELETYFEELRNGEPLAPVEAEQRLFEAHKTYEMSHMTDQDLNERDAKISAVHYFASGDTEKYL